MADRRFLDLINLNRYHKHISGMIKSLSDSIDERVEAKFEHFIEDNVSDGEILDARGDERTLGNRLKKQDEKISVLDNNGIGMSVKNFGALCDGITDDTEAIKLALQSEYKIITIESDCKISSTITLPIDKQYIFKGSFVISNNFTGNKVIEINNSAEGLVIDNISLVTEKFYKQDRHTLENNERTNFDGIVINNCRRLTIKTLKVVGITSRALVVNGGYEPHIDKIDIWGSNLNDTVSVQDAMEDKLLFAGQNERYTVGIVINGNDGIYNNVVSVGFNIGMTVQSANTVNVFHPWGYKATMLYGLVVKGAQNICSNLYLDTVKSIGSRTGAGVYEWKNADGNVGNGVEYNKYNNITALGFDENSYVFELGDSEKSTTSYMTSVSNLAPNYGIKLYKLHGTAKGNSLLDRLYGLSNFNYYSADIANFNYNTDNSFNEIISEIIEGNLQTHFNGMMCGVVFVDSNKVLSSKLPSECSLKGKQVIIKIENYSNKYFRCVVQGYGWPNSDSYILDLFRGDTGSYDYYSSYDCKYKVLSYLPSASDYSVGTCLFYKNKPVWRSSEGFWVDATGIQAK